MDIQPKEKDVKFYLWRPLFSNYAIPIFKEVHIFKEVLTT